MNKKRVTVSIPQYKCSEHINRAVSSILAQTHKDLLVIVTNDGDKDFHWDELSQIKDPRLVRFDLTSNQGRYFVDQVVLNSTPDKYLLIQDADDWSEKYRVEKLLEQIEEDSSNCAVSTVRMHATVDYPPPVSYVNWSTERSTPLDRRLINRLGHYGLFKTESLKEIGGYFGGFRIAYDRLIMNLLLMTGKVSFVEEPLYNYCRRSGSLTLDPNTDKFSDARREVNTKLEKIYDKTFTLYLDYLSNKIKREELLVFIRQLIDENISSKTKSELEAETTRLKKILQNS